MRIKLTAICVILILSLFTGCSLAPVLDSWGSFTNKDVYSSDGKYLATHESVRLEGYNVSMIQVSIFDAATGEKLSSFVPARAFDFKGVCWEDGAHNLWIQSADIGTHCYSPVDGQWQLNEDAVRPESIKSKYDKYN